jgi:hypothetical protein
MNIAIDHNQVTSMRIQFPVTAKRPTPLRWKWPGKNKFCLIILLLLFTEYWGGAVAQGLMPSLGTNSAPALGGAGGMGPPTQTPFLNGTQDATVKMHLGPTGKPCLTVFGYAQPQMIDPNIFDHMISAKNDCSQTIKMQVCYYHSQQCIPVDVPPYARKLAVLGIMPAMTQFQFEYREKFEQGIGVFGSGSN